MKIVKRLSLWIFVRSEAGDLRVKVKVILRRESGLKEHATQRNNLLIVDFYQIPQRPH